MSQTTTRVTNSISKASSTQFSSVTALSDHQLLTLCTHYGSQAKLWKQKFLGLLPEVERRKLYQAQGFSSLFEFAAKVGGVSKEQVKVVLSLYSRFEAMPALKQALVSGEVSVNKLARVVSVVTPQNQEFFLNQTTLLSKSALETLVRDVKRLPGQNKKPNKTEKIPQSEELNLASDVRQLLLDMQNKGIDHNQVLRELLKERNERIQGKKHSLAQEVKQIDDAAKQTNRHSRYIPQKVKTILKQEYGDKCAQETCTNKAANIHHTRRFGLNPSHNPLFLAPLCTQHHEIAHAVDVKVMERRRSTQSIKIVG
ncbi:MAG: hypothetical protein AAB558_05010 [Patescibacteria group bacterium]